MTEQKPEQKPDPKFKYDGPPEVIFGMDPQGNGPVELRFQDPESGDILVVAKLAWVICPLPRDIEEPMSNQHPMHKLVYSEAPMIAHAYVLGTHEYVKAASMVSWLPEERAILEARREPNLTLVKPTDHPINVLDDDDEGDEGS
jgi:hypothetical protein